MGFSLDALTVQTERLLFGSNIPASFLARVGAANIVGAQYIQRLGSTAGLNGSFASTLRSAKCKGVEPGSMRSLPLMRRLFSALRLLWTLNLRNFLRSRTVRLPRFTAYAFCPRPFRESQLNRA